MVTTGYDTRWAPEPVWTLWQREESYLPGIEPGHSVRRITATAADLASSDHSTPAITQDKEVKLV
jgi:hypothetical protein